MKKKEVLKYLLIWIVYNLIWIWVMAIIDGFTGPGYDDAIFRSELIFGMVGITLFFAMVVGALEGGIED